MHWRQVDVVCERAGGIPCVCVVVLECVGCMGCMVQDTSNLLFSAEMPYRQSAVIW